MGMFDKKDSPEAEALKSSIYPGTLKSSLEDVLYSRLSFTKIDIGEPLCFFQERQGETREDQTIVQADETNLTENACLPRGVMFQVMNIDVDGVPAIATNRVMVRLIIDQRIYEDGPLDIVRRLRPVNRYIDAVRLFRVELRFFDLSWATFPVTLRAELHGIRHRPIY